MAVYRRGRSDGTATWYYDFTFNFVRYRGIGGTTKTQALRVQERIRSDVIAGMHNHQPKPNNPAIEEFVKIYLERRAHLRSSDRDALSARNLVAYFKGKRLSGITPGNIEDYIVKRRRDGVTNATINRELACLKRMFNLAIKWREANTNPMKDVDLLEEPPGRTRYLSQEEATRLLDACNHYLRPIVFTALNTGMRLSEILSLQWDQVHIDRTIDPFIEIKKTKNNKSRFIPLNVDMIQMFKELMRGTNSDFVFVGRKNKPMQSIKKSFHSATAKAQIEDFKFHDLRHTFASHFIMQGGDLLTLKEILGHSSLKMVLRYAHLASAHKRKQINNLNGLFVTPHVSPTLGQTEQKVVNE